MTNILSRFVKDESGATAIEYGLIAAIVGVGIIAGLGKVQEALDGTFTTINEKMTGAGGEE
ncbi:Flp family type IVb pilin [Hyphomicrobium sp.]|uniref:Flp family type IVb pilin n=1 Tax=Hyphomicrobium sp. TaxID=82 RepID=UPI0025C3A432|nr:Flp family type IVb pilin [Hyphomicrobium sp.]MCC7253623.1 Flp family type IVb pilin [Hyphomicrobium sp.]